MPGNNSFLKRLLPQPVLYLLIQEIKSFEDAAGLSFEGGTGISVSNAVEAWNEKNPDKAINITYSDADTSVFLQHVADGSQDFTIIDLAMYNSYMEEFN